jgi:hypothetical protein
MLAAKHPGSSFRIAAQGKGRFWPFPGGQPRREICLAPAAFLHFHSVTPQLDIFGG